MLKRLSACAFAMLATILTTSTAIAQETYDKRTLFTFNQPITLPGVSLPPGTYTFRLASPNGDHRVVQIASADLKQVFATVFTRPVERPDVPETPDVRFLETEASMPAVVEAFWYPGRRHGWEFLYPAEQRMRIAEARRNVTRPAAVNTEDERR
jgi:hypothetical protein